MDERLAAAAEAAPPGQRILSGADAFLLYDSFGFPLELTQELAAAAGVETDMVGFAAAMEAQRARSAAGRESVDLTVGASVAELATVLGVPTVFSGYDDTSLSRSGCRVVGLMRDGAALEQVDELGRGLAARYCIFFRM